MIIHLVSPSDLNQTNKNTNRNSLNLNSIVNSNSSELVNNNNISGSEQHITNTTAHQLFQNSNLNESNLLYSNTLNILNNERMNLKKYIYIFQK